MHPVSRDHSFANSLAHIDELLAMIFAYLDDRALARAACVSKHWSEIALNFLWFEVNDLKRVLTVLAPSERYHTERGQRHKTLLDWARQLVRLLRRWYPQRALVVVADSTYAALAFLAAASAAPTDVLPQPGGP